MEKCRFKGCTKEVFKNSFCEEHYGEIIASIKIDDDLTGRSAKKSKEDLSWLLYLQTICFKVGSMFGSVINGYQKLFNVTVEDASFILEKRADVLLRKGKYEGAASRYEKIIRYKADDPKVLYNLGCAYSKTGKFLNAGKCFEQSIKLDDKNKDAHFQLGLAHLREEKYQEAIDVLNKLIKLDPNHVGAHYRKGIALDKMKNYDGAIASFQKAIAINPTIAKIYQSLGFSLESKGEHSEAVKHFKKAIDLEEA